MVRGVGNGERGRRGTKHWAMLSVSLSEWRTCPTHPTHTVAGMFELCEQPWPPRLLAIHKTRVSPSSDSTCRLFGTVPDSVAHIFSFLVRPALAQTNYAARHGAGPILRDPIWSRPDRYCASHQTAAYLWNSGGTGLLGCSGLLGVSRTEGE